MDRILLRIFVFFLLACFVASDCLPGAPGNGDKVTMNFNFADIIETRVEVSPAAAPLPPMPSDEPNPGDILITLALNRVTTLPKLLTYDNLTRTAKGANSSAMFTVFAPTDGAFSCFPDFESLFTPAAEDRLDKLLKYHVVAGRYTSDMLKALTRLTTLEGESLAISTTPDGRVYVNGVVVRTPDVIASNGIIHIIPEVLVPASLRIPSVFTLCQQAGGGNFTNLLLQAGISESFRSPFVNYTVFCPTNEAFAQLGTLFFDQLASSPRLTPFLRYFVSPNYLTRADLLRGIENYPQNSKNITSLEGSPLRVHIRNLQIRVNEVLIRQFDLTGLNGVVHIIDRVYFPPSQSQNALQLAATLGLTTFLALVDQAGLTSALSQTGPYTFLIPTNEALANVTLPPNFTAAQLRIVLLYHVVSSPYLVADLPASVSTQIGLSLTATAPTLSSPAATFNGIPVVRADFPVVNGVLHVINGVLLPPAEAFTTPAPTTVSPPSSP